MAKNNFLNLPKTYKFFYQKPTKKIDIYTASCVRQNFPFLKEYYNVKYKEVTKHQHKRALVLSARKLERLIFGLLRKNQYYKPIDSVQISKIN